MKKLFQNQFKNNRRLFSTIEEWVPPNKIENLYKATEGNKFASINSPTAGARNQVDLPVGKAKFQYYSIATPNGMKPAILLEELGVDYDAHKINLRGSQFDSGFVDINPNSKIPAAVDYDGPNGKVIKLFESGSIMLYLADKYKRFIPPNADPYNRAQVINWLFWQMSGQGPTCGNFGHFFVYAPPDKKEARDYGVARYGMEVQRLCSVLENHIKSSPVDGAKSHRTYIVGEEYSIADMAIFPWFHQLRTGYIHPSGISASEFLSIEKNYPYTVDWADKIWQRDAVQRGMSVCRFDTSITKPWIQKQENVETTK